MELQKTPDSHSDPEKENKVGGIMLPYIKPQYKVIVINGTELSPEKTPHLHGQLVYGKGGKNIHWVKTSIQ